MPKIKMTPVDRKCQQGILYVSLDSVLADGGKNPKKHEHKIKKYSPVPRIGDGN